MPNLLVSKELHTKWKVYCSKKEVKMIDATEIALELAMKSKIKIKNN